MYVDVDVNIDVNADVNVDVNVEVNLDERVDVDAGLCVLRSCERGRSLRNRRGGIQ